MGMYCQCYMQQDALIHSYLCFVATCTNIWIKLLCSWMPYEQVTRQGFDSWQTGSGAHVFFYSVCTRAFVQG